MKEAVNDFRLDDGSIVIQNNMFKYVPTIEEKQILDDMIKNTLYWE